MTQCTVIGWYGQVGGPRRAEAGEAEVSGEREAWLYTSGKQTKLIQCDVSRRAE